MRHLPYILPMSIWKTPRFRLGVFCLASMLMAFRLCAQELRIPLTPPMIQSSSENADFSGLAENQDFTPGSTNAAPKRGWEISAQYWNQFPFSATIDLGQLRNLSSLWFYDTHGTGMWTVATGEPGHWQIVLTNDCALYQQWVHCPLEVTSRYLRIKLESGGANFAGLALYEFTPEGFRTRQAQLDAEKSARVERDAAMAKAREEVSRRPWIELPPFGRVQVVDEVDCGSATPGHLLRESPSGASRVETILGRSYRILQPTTNQSSYMAFRIGQWKLLKPGAAYVLSVEYPEDQPRSYVVMNGGNETSRGFHTGTTIGDALHAKYVNGNPESLQMPLTGGHQTWSLYFNLHDRFPDLVFLRGPKERKLSLEDGFDVVIAQFSAPNDPTSHGAAVSRIRLLEVPDEAALAQPLRLPPEPLPRRHITWREEMADGVIESDKESECGVKTRLDWYRYKANQMRFLGMNTFSKDLLEFGACQHWDPTPYGGNDWIHFASGTKDLWAQIVSLMGERGLELMPYYEYAGSKGYHGLGYQRRCQPLTRDDAFTAISWVESANADITDPDTLADFQKMLDVTVVRLKDKCRFDGIWLRPRWQLPMSFAESTRGRFAREANDGRAVSRAELIADKKLLERYEAWWFGKRRAFLLAVRDYLRANGLPEAMVLFTAEAGEPGPAFPTWEKQLVTDDVEGWRAILKTPGHVADGKAIRPISVQSVVDGNLYLEALQAAPLNWGAWEINHANPPADPARYRETPGVLMTHCFNRSYTVKSPATFDAFRGPMGLALVRHYSLNENMMFDSQDGEKLGYFVADFERAGPACMMAEVLAMANGDPNMLGYLLGNNLGRGFPIYVREFNANYLALPALPSQKISNACDDNEIAVRVIRTEQQGAWMAVVNTTCKQKNGIKIRTLNPGAPYNAVTGDPLPLQGDKIELSLHPYELRTVRWDAQTKLAK